jgi:hypothetical protein
VYTVTPDTAEAVWEGAVTGAKDLAQDFHKTEDGVLAAINMGSVIVENCFPDALHEAAADFNTFGNEQGALLVRGLREPSELADVKAGRLLTDQSSRAFGLMAVAVTTLFGPPVGYRSPDGIAAFLTQVTPTEDTGPIVSTGRAGGWHAEFAATPNRPSTFILSCVRSGNAQTKLMPTHRVIERLEVIDSSIFERLREARYITPDGFIRDNQRKGPLLIDINGQPSLVLGEEYQNYQNPHDLQSLETMRILYEVLDDPTLPILHRIGPGEALAVHNRTCLHARTEIIHEPNRSSRWLMRTFVGEAAMSTIVEDVWSSK